MLCPAKACDTITDKDRVKLEAYIKTWYKLPNKQTVALVDTGTVDGRAIGSLFFAPVYQRRYSRFI
jgi:hypothetical protein